MQIEVRTHDAARAQTRAVVGSMHAVVALLLLLLMPLGMLHRSSTGTCRYDQHAALVGSAVAVSDVGHDVPFSASAAHARAVMGDQHDHRGSDLPLDGAAPSACGPAALAERPAPMSAALSQAVLPAWRALSPIALAAPPPAPPPRLS